MKNCRGALEHGHKGENRSFWCVDGRTNRVGEEHIGSATYRERKKANINPQSE